ncbi:DUF3152 domain-containing protein [Nocardiopsis xinjiangensis]|uniref:DUF3152 domain-containing protein n=1 Tax=Nocardiopsis xinjiangensis TaxID=124285 RepID=UPI0003475506
MPTKRPRHRRRRRCPTGIALGLCIVSGAAIVLMVSVPEDSDDPPMADSSSSPASDGVPEDDRRHEAEPDEQGSSTTAPEEDEENPLLRSIEEEVDTADGDIETLPGESEVMGDGPLTTFAVEMEQGLPGADEDFAEAVEVILGDPRSWGEDGERSLQRVGDTDDADVRVLLAAPDTVDDLCAPLSTNGYVSCAQGDRAIINQNRWVAGVDHFDGDLETYRIYLINHEVGHTFGHGHVDCPGEGELAPVMQQQTLGLQGCEPSGWVDPGE